MSDADKPWLSITPGTMEKVAVSIALMAIAMFYLVSGRQQANVSRMITGAILALASVALFAL
ncbi:MAG: hypothetical protein M0D55_12435 [Elusimicrobiota bacterium]|nr:MAG: hypothetical protein M0D55_12435 [Elusimicrobiota bacterium]